MPVVVSVLRDVVSQTVHGICVATYRRRGCKQNMIPIFPSTPFDGIPIEGTWCDGILGTGACISSPNDSKTQSIPPQIHTHTYTCQFAY